MRPQGRAARGRRPVRGTGLHGGLDAAEGGVSAVHGALLARRALQDAAQPPRMGVGGPEGRVRPWSPGNPRWTRPVCLFNRKWAV